MLNELMKRKGKEMKLRFRRSMAIGISIVLIIQLCGLWNINVAYADSSKETYIVITKDAEAAQEIIKTHNVDSEEGEVLTVILSPQEAAHLEADKDVVCVEKDFTIEQDVEIDEKVVKPLVEDWNLKAINAEDTEVNSTVKVAVIDSGIDYTEDIVVKERRNFIADDPVTTPLFEDTCGHGTSVASIIAGKGIESHASGINGNIEIYSARVLDQKKQAPISRVIEAIYWAIEKDVNIINISFGTQQYSEALKTAIDAATDDGILVIASTGNYGNSSIDYPAAFENVLAVGATNAAGKISDFSAGGEKVDLVAPGEAIAAQGNFGEKLILSGTSLAASHVTGVAACLWSKDLTKTSTFIKVLLKLSTKKMNCSNSGYGLIDYEQALELYNEIGAQFDSISEESVTISADENTAPVQELQDAEDVPNSITQNNDEEKNNTESDQVDAVIREIDNIELEEKAIDEIEIIPNIENITDYSDPLVTGSWTAAIHEAYSANAKMKSGATISDKEESGVKGMTSHSEFHGFSWHGTTDSGLNSGTCNYIANYKYLVLVANKVGAGGSYTSVECSDVIGLNSTCHGKLKTGVGNIIKTSQYKACTSSTEKKAFLMGVAMHAATDAFAHSAFHQKQAGAYSWVRITHTSNAADDPDVAPKRVQMAYAVEKNVISRYKGNRSGEKIGNDFHDDTGDCYQLPILFRQNKIMTFAQSADITKSSIISDFKLLQTGGR
ncbi:S8 family serine peptidase [Anaerovoracaceae bacterium 41-7]